VTTTSETAAATAPDTPLPVTLAVGNQPHCLPLKRGEVRSDRLAVDLVEIDPIHTSFRPMVRELSFDVCEMAIVSYLMAKDRGVGVTLIPAVMLGRRQQPLFIHNAARGPLTPAELPGKRVGVRAYSQTTGAWIRGILGDEYGVDFHAIDWVTFEGSHVPYDDPAWVRRAPQGKELLQMLIDGEIDAAIAEKTADPRLQPVIPDADATAAAWAASLGLQPVNHLVVVRTALVEQHPWLPAEVYRLLKQSKALAPPETPDPIPFGVEANRRAFDLIARYAFEQGLVSRRYSTDDLFDATTRDLN
jgi:4,5-dihydroxyphthalate decarboxylase